MASAAQQQQWDGYGPGWNSKRKKTLKRDNYTCQRCGYTKDDSHASVPLQAHHIVPRSEGGPDTLDNLITLCRRCHGVQHPDNEVFDDDRAEAPLFPYEESDPRVSQMRDEDAAECSRCGLTFNAQSLVGLPSELLDKDSPTTVCKPCAGVLCDMNDDVTVNALFGRTAPTARETLGRKTKTHPLPLSTTDLSDFSAAREPTSWTERIFGKFPRLRLFGTLLLFVAFLLAGLEYTRSGDALTIVGLEVLGPTQAAVFKSWVGACILAPIVRWGSGTLLYKTVAVLDPSHDSEQYTPSLSATFSRIWDGITTAFVVSVGYLIIGLVLVVVLGILIVLVHDVASLVF